MQWSTDMYTDAENICSWLLKVLFVSCFLLNSSIKSLSLWYLALKVTLHPDRLKGKKKSEFPEKVKNILNHEVGGEG